MKCLSHKQRDQKNIVSLSRTVCGYSACVICTWLNQGKKQCTAVFVCPAAFSEI